MFCCLHFTCMYSSVLYFLLPKKSSIGSQKVPFFSVYLLNTSVETPSLTAQCFDLGCRQAVAKIQSQGVRKNRISCHFFASAQLHGICFKSARNVTSFHNSFRKEFHI